MEYFIFELYSALKERMYLGGRSDFSYFVADDQRWWKYSVLAAQKPFIHPKRRFFLEAQLAVLNGEDKETIAKLCNLDKSLETEESARFWRTLYIFL